jgi:aryl-alcohol dehydrogenase-like predicted oxidoreductase
MNHSRRSFLKTSAAMSVGMAATECLTRAAAPDTDTVKKVEPINTEESAPADIPLLEGAMQGEVRKEEMVYRPLGGTGEMVSLIGMGGFHLGKTSTEDEAIRLIHAAIDNGINFMDNSWDYNLGESELRAGKAYKEGGYRDKVFQMTKIDGRTKKAAMRQIEESLTRLQTDHIELIQHHEVIRMEDPDSIFKEDGAMAAFLEAKQQGKLRFIGFTGHKDPLIHLRMLQVARENGFHFDTVQMPINVMDAHFRSFSAQVLPVLLREKIAPLAMKTFGDHFVLDGAKQAGVDPIDMLHFSMSLPVAVVITGIDKQEVLDQALQAAKTYQPMNKAAALALLDRTRSGANKGEFELYKTTWHFDSTAQNPDWLGLKKEQSV